MSWMRGWLFIISLYCGRITLHGEHFEVDGNHVVRGELPWHAFIYQRNISTYEQFCGGSLINARTVISVAHCFWNEEKGQESPQLYAVALGKVFRSWDDPRDKNSQRSNVSEIHMPRQFRGHSTKYQSDITILLLETEIVYQTFIRPVCINYDVRFTHEQLQPGSLGKIASLGYGSVDCLPSQILQATQLPYVSHEQCYKDVEPNFREFLTIDKYCTGFSNGSLCGGVGGNGLVFPATEKGVQRYYLQGMLSMASWGFDGFVSYYVFTEIRSHEQFLKDTLIKY